MEKELKEINGVLQALEVQIALNAIHLKTLTTAFQELSNRLLPSDEAKSLQQYYYRTLIDGSTLQLQKLGSAEALRALFDLQEFVQSRLDEL